MSDASSQPRPLVAQPKQSASKHQQQRLGGASAPASKHRPQTAKMASSENTPEMNKADVRGVVVHDDSQEEPTSTRQPPTLDLPPPPDSSRQELVGATTAQHVKTGDDKEKITRPTSIELKHPDTHGPMHKVDLECSLATLRSHFTSSLHHRNTREQCQQ
jgi:hypothetical protein